MYQTGDIRHLRADDPEHEERAAAERDVLERSTLDPDGFFGVWRGPEEGSELLAIAHQGALFRAA
ncbi:MAG TPA: hypothetical protein VF541_14785 [Longimicrobium sp.]|jgi:hypothetical protein